MSAAAAILAGSLEKTAMHTSALTGQRWVDELLDGVGLCKSCIPLS
jgi:hypothetical protein